MIKKTFITLGLLLFTSSVFAHDMNLSWNSQPDATGYSIRHSLDGGLTWGPETDVGLVTSITYTVPDTGLVLVQVAAYNTNGITWRLDSGLFYNGDWRIPDKPTNMGVE